ncbi:MAG: glycosyl hydrolase [candidate division KSB1 bacterium]|nr:glycosyl hydrolase [candidate division KSB1 bacterium]MDZ7365880.1 glycosyl hydrolase [candidate division KSB1 bacterium]MDZ7403885.1 glycosyl hydrolase [candidate division KSB1 bacterium]
MRSKILYATLFALTANDVSAQAYQVQWQEQKSGLTSSFRGLCAVNEKIVWVSGTRGSYARTLNGGQTWAADSVAGAAHLDFRDVEAFDAKRAYLMSAGPGELSRIYKTLDGGKSWQLQHQNKIPEGFFNGMAFWGENNGVVIGDPVNGRLFILLTSDGGATWQQLANAPEVVAGEYGFAASGTGVTVYGKHQLWIATGGAMARVFYTRDRGKTWRVSDTPLVSGNQSSGIFSIAFRDEKHGVIAGGDYQKPDEARGNVAFTNDGGKTWRLLKNPEAVGFLSCVAYVPQKSFSLLAVGTSGSYFSTDNGQSWNKFSAEGYHTLSFAQSTSSGWAAGADGRIAKCIIMPNDK